LQEDFAGNLRLKASQKTIIYLERRARVAFVSIFFAIFPKKVLFSRCFGTIRQRKSTIEQIVAV
jgi:hypothetical protein